MFDLAAKFRKTKSRLGGHRRLGSFDLRSLPVPYTPPAKIVERASPQVAIVFAIAAFYYALCLGIASPQSDHETINIVHFSHVCIPILAVGIAVLPLRLVWLAFAVFALTFVVLELIMFGGADVSGWSAMGMVKGLIASAAVGTIGGVSVRILMRERSLGGLGLVPEQIGLVGGLVVLIVGSIIGLFALWIELHGETSPERFWSLGYLMSQRMFRLGAITSAATLLFLAFPPRSALPEILLQASAFSLLGALAQNGYSLDPRIDPVLLAMAFVFLRPVTVSIAGVLAGFALYIFMTGTFVDLPVNLRGAEFRAETQANILFFVLLIVATARVTSLRVQKIQAQMLGRMSRAQELSRYGYLMYNLNTQTASFDPLTQKILQVRPSLHADAFLQRVNPEDRDTVVKGSTTRDPAGVTFTFRLSMDGPWQQDSEERVFRGFCLFELTDDGQKMTYGIVVDVTDEHQREAQLRKVLVELSERQGQQTQLFSIISHELRTPASILSMLADELDSGRQWRDVGPKMRGVLEQLLSILSDMRQTVRPEQNLPIRLEQFEPAEVVTAVADGFRGMAQARGIALHVKIGEGGHTPCVSDRVRLNQVLSNLLKNAILHSQATEIRLIYQNGNPGFGVWTVADNGRNIPAEQRESLFMPFARGKSEGMRVDGSGLGLYVAKSAIELLGGSLEYVEQATSGAVFKITLPLNQPDHVAPLTETSQPDLGDLAKLSVLIVEDSETMGEILVARLKSTFAKVDWQRDGASGLDFAMKEKPDVVMTDLFMPILTGDELTRRLRAAGHKGRIIGMTAAEMGEDVEMFRQSGVDVILTKPVRVKDLERALGKANQPPA